eukprot:gnl/TRDRNA2_/TRDRNA2_198447_c0_seq1.p1 gnl/TRDRNA2_/TRDRNA2_198447_c0~~gnl/TRDRNA2_/TRDRNA2_198447_c0_seq1.p1  ORF type:complete len:314 (-),score=64.58 gnl/TRDRNA2_/TRDRNA2_198447_c0_seq1:74-1015(-)
MWAHSAADEADGEKSAIVNEEAHPTQTKSPVQTMNHRGIPVSAPLSYGAPPQSPQQPQQPSEPQGQVDAAFIEELRVKLFEAAEGPRSLYSRDQRGEIVFDKIVERLQEEPDEGDRFEAKHYLRPRSFSVLTRQWQEYVREQLASIDRRSTLVDAKNEQRVARYYRQSGALRYIDLNDYQGRLRARILYDSAGEPIEVRLISSKGKEASYTRESFDQEPGQAPFMGTSLIDRFERARRNSVSNTENNISLKQKQLTKQSIESLCNDSFERLEQLLKREGSEGRQLVPTGEELIEMSLEQTLEHLEKMQIYTEA